MASRSKAASNHVFLNVPFDPGYEPLFVTLVGTLVFLGQTPHCALEVRESGDGRLQRIFDLMGRCGMSIHDLSRVGSPARLNMAFELGLACSRRLNGERHEVVVLESKDYRLDKTLSDYKGRDPLVHYNRCDDMITCLLDIMTDPSLPDPDDLRESAATLRRTVRAIKRRLGAKTIFRPSAFRALSDMATHIGIVAGFFPG